MNIVDEHTREAPAMRVGRTCDADHVVAVIGARVEGGSFQVPIRGQF